MSKKQRRSRYQQQNLETLSPRSRKTAIEIYPKSQTQALYLEYLNDRKKDIIIATGPAGTGKTHVAVLHALRAFKFGDCTKIILTRPAVSVDEKHGHLPGTLIEKMAPWTRPITDIFEEFYSPRDVNRLIEENIFEIVPLAYMRGRTFKHSVIIADEMQNATVEQTKMLLTRIGEESRIFMNGDLEQHDRGYEENGLRDFVNRLEHSDSDLFGIVKFTKSDITRHRAVEAVLELYPTK